MSGVGALKVWQRLALAEHAGLVDAAATIGAGDVAGIARLRKMCPDIELVRAALQLAEGRRKALAKFGRERAGRLWADPEGVEMATSAPVAACKAVRFRRTLGDGAAIVDLCSGVGGDAMGLVEAGMRVTCVDADPARAWMAGMNAGCVALVLDVLDPQVPSGAFHVDPARRGSDGRRTFRLEDLAPGPDVIRTICSRRDEWGGCIKLGPGVSHQDALGLAPGELEFFSEQGRLTQCALWVGPLAGIEERRATLLIGREGSTLAGPADREIPPVGPIGAFVHEIDPCVERAQLLCMLCDRLGADMAHPQLGLLTGEQVMDHPMLTAFRVLDVLGWHERKVRAAVESLGGGIVEVKTRGKAVDPDVVQQLLRGRGDRPLVVFVLRFDREVRAIIAERLPPRAIS